MQLIEQHIPKKWPAYWKGNWRLHFDSCRVHTADAVTQFSTRRDIEIVPNPAYSSDLAPNDFHLYPVLKRMLQGRPFPTLQVIHVEVYTQLQCLPEEGFTGVFKKEECWNKCLCADGNYIERVHNLQP